MLLPGGCWQPPRLQDRAPPAPHPPPGTSTSGHQPAGSHPTQCSHPLRLPSVASRGGFQSLGGIATVLNWDPGPVQNNLPCFKAGGGGHGMTGKPATRAARCPDGSDAHETGPASRTPRRGARGLPGPAGTSQPTVPGSPP